MQYLKFHNQPAEHRPRYRNVVIIAAVLVIASAIILERFARAEVIEEIIAQVNDKIIVLSDYQKSMAQLRSDLGQQGLSGLQLEGRFNTQSKDTLRDLIDNQLLVQKAADLGINADADLVKKLDEIRKSMNLTSMDALEQAASQQGMNYEDFKANLKNQILTQDVIQREVGSHVTVTPAEIQAYYDEHKNEMARKDGVAIQEILVSTEDKPADELPARKQRADEALAKIKSGTTFDDAAKEYSDASSASSGGQAGFFEKGSMNAQLQSAVDALQPNQVSDVIQLPFGYMIVKLLSRTTAGIPPEPEVDSKIYEQIYLKKIQPALRVYLTRLRLDAYISIKPGYNDSGAAPEQAAAAAPSSAQPSAPKAQP